ERRTTAGPALRRPATRRRLEGSPATAGRRPRLRAAATRSDGGAADPAAGTCSGSGAVAAVHALLVRQLAPVLDEVALPAGELLVRIRGDHLDRERLDALLPPQREDRLLVLLLLGCRALLWLLGEDVLEARFGLLRLLQRLVSGRLVFLGVL